MLRLLRVLTRCVPSGGGAVLALLVVLGVCTTLLALCLYLYCQNRKLYRIIRCVTADSA